MRALPQRVNDTLLRKLWPTAMTDKEMAARMGHHRGVLHRRAAAIQLPPRRIARLVAIRNTEHLTG